MPRALRDVGAAVTCLQLLLLVSGAEPRPHGWDGDRTQLEAVKKGILERLGMSAPPVVRQRLDQESIRRAQRLYRQKVAEVMRNQSREEEEEEGSVSRSRRLHRLTPTLLRWPDVPQGHQDPRGPYRYRLVLPHTETFHRQLRVARAELKLFKKSLASHATSPLATSLSPRVSIYVLGGAHETPKLLRSQELDRDTLSLDITAAVQPWAAGAEDTLRLELAFTANVTASLATSAGETLLLEVETHEPTVRRARRARGLEEECGKSDGKCCLKSLKVSFQDIGWSDWVIAPNSYYMRFCEGSCPHNYKPASMHAQIKARMHSLSKATPPPCCVPAAYDPMVLMHYDGQGRLVSTVFEDMLVTKCHCA
ncbi:growth/differentiation factor 15 [Patagioenas fasciata monilis]|uniref:Growth/differentiation factor 15 n=1 Tax=Patagioenas fasciata monilis TaxID=372326 RepID=A0A1V4KQG3_PATFA|nr:growth/differentiation factor 15 [Patagioenas fasciata monilis]